MVQLTSIFSSLARTISFKNERKVSILDVAGGSGKEAADSMAKEARKNGMLLTSSGFINSNRSSNDNVMVSAYSKKGQKGPNQDRLVVWQEFGCQEDMTFCGIFDGHGSWGHIVAKQVKKLMPSLLLCNWQQTLVACQCAPLKKPPEEVIDDGGECQRQFEVWKESYLRTCSAVDYRLSQLPGIDSFYSGSTALTVVKQGDEIYVANIGDSRAVLATTCDDGCLVATQLTVDLKPNQPQESKRIEESRGRIFSSRDEPGVYRVWMPNEGPGLAISRAFGDYYMKEFGLISDPELTHRTISSKDEFLIVATDGVCVN
ncbi:OLC1v1020693C3 [Oldenlandia corymbosa var. corymbosa]|uniref:OLC1v1020693C3 n=1 Tax=Oldenlandia corymbosa var. corymbosa TaxID=529605 RepID=A0AAV1EH96_OLDCO|nr:OLC1v1020693C3 [Oldenlandia corymbosa var. corymbosa]